MRIIAFCFALTLAGQSLTTDVAGISGLGAYGSGGHAPGETIEMMSQTPQARRVALFIYALTR